MKLIKHILYIVCKQCIWPASWYELSPNKKSPRFTLYTMMFIKYILYFAWEQCIWPASCYELISLQEGPSPDALANMVVSKYFICLWTVSDWYVKTIYFIWMMVCEWKKSLCLLFIASFLCMVLQCFILDFFIEESIYWATDVSGKLSFMNQPFFNNECEYTCQIKIFYLIDFSARKLIWKVRYTL